MIPRRDLNEFLCAMATHGGRVSAAARTITRERAVNSRSLARRYELQMARHRASQLQRGNQA